MRRPAGLLLLVVGCSVMLGGAALALREFAGLYRGVLDDPLGQPEGFEKGVSRRMLVGAGVGALGAPVAIVGLVTLKAGRRRRDVEARRRHRPDRPAA